MLLVDANLRHPQIHDLLGMANGEGLSELLTILPVTRQMVETCIEGGPVANLWVLTAGNTSAHPAELLSGERTARLGELLCELADVVIYDTPPVLAVTDATLLASRADATLLVIRAGAGGRGAVLRALQVLQQVGATLLPPILNGVHPARMEYQPLYMTRSQFVVESGKPPPAAHANGVAEAEPSRGAVRALGQAGRIVCGRTKEVPLRRRRERVCAARGPFSISCGQRADRWPVGVRRAAPPPE